jgi:hypothetical protein
MGVVRIDKREFDASLPVTHVRNMRDELAKELEDAVRRFQLRTGFFVPQCSVETKRFGVSVDVRATIEVSLDPPTNSY